MAGIVCLQGGREFTAACEPMDRVVLDRCAGPVVVLAGAARPGDDYAKASGRAKEHYERLGARVVIAPDPRRQAEQALAALEVVGLLVLPGGSPASLKQVLSGEVRDRVMALRGEGAGLSGASAGAMVLCHRMSLPSQGERQVDGLNVVPGVAQVHWSGPTRGRPPPDGLLRWGLPECGGVLIDDDGVVAVGEGRPSWLRAGRWRELPRDTPVPMPAQLGS